MSQLRRSSSRVFYDSDGPWRARLRRVTPFDDIPECGEETEEAAEEVEGEASRDTRRTSNVSSTSTPSGTVSGVEADEAGVGGECHSPSQRSHDSGFSDSSDGGPDDRRLISRVYIQCRPTDDDNDTDVAGRGKRSGDDEAPKNGADSSSSPMVTSDERYAEMTRRAGRRLYSRVGADVQLSPSLARRPPHVRTIRVDSGGADSAASVSVLVGGAMSSAASPSTGLRRRWSFAELRDEEDDTALAALTPSPSMFALASSLTVTSSSSLTSVSALAPSSVSTSAGGSQSLPRRHTVTGCRLQLRAAAVRSRSVRQWLQDLGTLCEPECSTTLQAKSLVSDATRLLQQMTDRVGDSLRDIQVAAKAVSQAFAALCRRLEALSAAELHAEVERLVWRADRLSGVYRPPAAAARSRSLRPLLETDLEATRAAVAAAAARLLDAADPRQLVAAVTALGGAITQLVDQLLTQQLRVLTEALRPPHVLSCARAALLAATAAGAQGCHLSGLFCQLGGVRQLLTLATDRHFAPLQVHVLRALSAVCCALPCVRAMEQEGGVDLVCGLLCDLSLPAAVRHESVAVLAQMTAPWLTTNHSVCGLTRHLSDIVPALKELAALASVGDEVLLLAAAALANLTFVEPAALPLLTTHGVAEALVAAADRLPESVFVLDQVSTVLANVAGSDSGGALRRLAVPALVRYLHVTVDEKNATGARAAGRRLQQKVAVALTRLCTDRRTACHLVTTGGTARLERLCRQPELRAGDDGVLVACLTALRKILSFVPHESGHEVTDLVQPKLMEVFARLCSDSESREERQR